MTKAIANHTSAPDKLTKHILKLQNEIEQLRHQVKTLTQEKELNQIIICMIWSNEEE